MKERVTCMLCGKVYKRYDAMTLFRHLLEHHERELVQQALGRISSRWGENLRRAGEAAADAIRRRTATRS